MSVNMRLAALLLAWALLITALAVGAQQLTIAVQVEQLFLVERATDGDTIRIAPLTDAQELWFADRGAESVRLLCVSAPELNEPGGPEARAWLTDQLAGGPLELEPGPDRRDNFGRILAFARVGPVDLNLEVVRQGLARADRRFPCLRRAEMLAAEAEAQAAGRGLWAR